MNSMAEDIQQEHLHRSLLKPIVVKVKLDCCNKCPNKLRKAFLRIHGVQSVEAYAEMNLAVVTGKVDPKILIDSIKRAGKEATLGCLQDLKQCNKKDIHSDDHHKCSNKKDIHSDDHHHVEENHDCFPAREERCHEEEYYTAGGKDKCPQNEYFQQNPGNKAKKCYCNGDPNYNKKRRDGDDDVVENVEGARCEDFDGEVCKDNYCRVHRRNHGGVPPLHERPPMYWDHQPGRGLGRSGYFPAGQPPPWFRDLHYQTPNPFGYPSSSMPPPPYGYHPSSSMPPPSYGRRRPPFGNDNCGDFEPNRGCATM